MTDRDAQSEKEEKSKTFRMNAGDLGAKYQGALEAALSIPVGAGIGYFCDKQFDSAPVGLLLGFGFGFGAFILRIVRMRPPTTSENDEENSS